MKISDISKDFNLKSKDVVDVFKEAGIEKKNSGAAVDEEEFEIFFSLITKSHQIKNIDAYTGGSVTISSVKEKAEYIFNELSSADGVKSVSGMGLMIGIETERDAKEVVAACREKGVLVLTAKTKVRLLPALNIPDELLKKAVEIIKECVK